MKVALFHAYKLFVKEHPGVKVRRRNFEMQKPKHITLEKDGQRLVCASMYHVNIDCLLKALNNLLSVNNVELLDNIELLNEPLCNSVKTSCITWLCGKCQEFKKLGNVLALKISILVKHMIDQIDCSAKTYTVKINLFQRADYLKSNLSIPRTSNSISSGCSREG